MATVPITTAEVYKHGLIIRNNGHVDRFDRTGRFVSRASARQTVRRGLDHRMVEMSMTGTGTATVRTYRDLDDVEKSTFLGHVYDVANTTMDALPEDERQTWTRQLQRWTPVSLAGDREAFGQVYLPVSILPPDQYHALVVQVTHGCSYNRCLFCDFYRDRPFHIKTTDELRRHVQAIKTFFGPRIQARTGIFLADGNALVIPTQKLLTFIETIRAALGEPLGNFSTFMDTFSLERKTSVELNALRTAGLTTVYVGLETGSDALRRHLDKPGSGQEATDAINRLKDSGFRVGVIVLIGAGGETFSKQHFEDTQQVLRNIRFNRDDIVFLSPFVEPDHSVYRETSIAQGIVPFSSEEIQGEVHRWRRHLSTMDLKVTTYPIQQHLY